PRSLISRTASTLNSRLNLRRCIPHLRFHYDTQTGCPRNRKQATPRKSTRSSIRRPARSASLSAKC
ncbi:hypothetical protein FV220_23270, partial [Methylobacterium sp. WL19]